MRKERPLRSNRLADRRNQPFDSCKIRIVNAKFGEAFDRLAQIVAIEAADAACPGNDPRLLCCRQVAALLVMASVNHVSDCRRQCAVVQFDFNVGLSIGRSHQFAVPDIF